MNTFRFVLYTWLCSVLLYPCAVMIGDIFSRSNTESNLFLPLLAGALVLGLPLLVIATGMLRLLQRSAIAPPVRYATWVVVILASMAGMLWLLADPTLTGTGEDARFVWPLFAETALVLTLRYPLYSSLPQEELHY